MRVALDVRATRQLSAGMKTYNRELASRLPEVAPDLEFIHFEHARNFSLQEQFALPRAMRRAGVELAHFLSQYTPLLPPRPYIVTIHDLIHLRFPQFFKAKVGPYYQTVVRFAATRAARIITDDPRTVGDLERYLGVKPANCRVIALGVEEYFLQPIAPYVAARPYILYVGNHREHKDLRTLFSAWSSLPHDTDLDLYLTGPDDFKGALADYQSPNRRILTLGDVSKERLAALYAGARALVHPALCEGFGLPMLEAMACGTLVIACTDAVPAVLEGATLRFTARDVAGLRSSLEQLGDEGLRSGLVNKGRSLARAMTWTRCARATVDVYREVLEEQR